MSQDRIELKIPNSREKLKTLFPEDPRGDFKVVFQSKVFKLQKAYLRLQSGFFKKKCLSDITILEIKETFNIHPQYLQQELFSAILSCFYGNTIIVPRAQVLLYYPIIKFLEVDSLLTQLRKDMIEHIQNYDLFVLMRMAHQFNEQQLFQTCLFQLQKQGFEQMNYNNSELLNCSVQLFKLIIKTHNRRKSQGNKGLDYKVIDNFIKQYCEANSLEEEKYHEYKFELIDKTKLTAKEYKEIFMDQLSKPRQTRQSFMKTADIGGFKSNQSSTLVSSSHPMFQSIIGPTFRNPTNDLTLEMQNTFHKKENQELKQQKQELTQYINKLKDSTKYNQLVNSQLQKELEGLREKLKIKDKEQKQQKGIIARLQDMMKNMEKSQMQKDASIKKLETKIQQLCKTVNSHTFKGEQDSLIIQSQIIPSNLIGNFMKKQPIQTKPKPISITNNNKACSQSLDEFQIQELYQDRISFDIAPIAVQKTYLPILVNFLGTDGFNQKKLHLIFRRSSKHPQIGTPESLRNRKGIVILIRTANGQHIGGYISVTITESATDYIQDPNAFIFSLSKGKKFNVKPSSEASAVFLSSHYLIGFGNDLFISKDVLAQESYCDWSSSYEKGNEEEQGSVWFAGGHQFMVKDLQVYEVEEEEMVMSID